MAVKFRHKTLAKTHNFVIALSFRIEIRSAFASADRKPRKRIFQNLFEPEKFNHGKIDGRMKTQTALIGADRTVELNAIPFIDVYNAVIVYPRDPEQYGAFRLYETFEQRAFFIFGMGFDYGHKRG